jgi:hypothetical protein
MAKVLASSRQRGGRRRVAKARGTRWPPNAFVGVVVVAPVGLGGGWVPHGLATTTTPPFPRKQAAFVSSRHAAHALPPTRQ